VHALVRAHGQGGADGFHRTGRTDADDRDIAAVFLFQFQCFFHAKFIIGIHHPFDLAFLDA